MTDGGADNFVQVAYLYNVTGMTDEAALKLQVADYGVAIFQVPDMYRVQDHQNPNHFDDLFWPIASVVFLLALPNLIILASL